MCGKGEEELKHSHIVTQISSCVSIFFMKGWFFRTHSVPADFLSQSHCLLVTYTFTADIAE